MGTCCSGEWDGSAGKIASFGYAGDSGCLIHWFDRGGGSSFSSFGCYRAYRCRDYGCFAHGMAAWMDAGCLNGSDGGQLGCLVVYRRSDVGYYACYCHV